VRAAVGQSLFVADAAATVLLAALGVMAAVRVGIDTSPPGYRPPPTVVWVLLTLALVLPLAWRRRFPLVVLVVVTVVFFPYRWLDVSDLTVSVVVWWLALYSAGAYGQGAWRNRVRLLDIVSALGFLAYRLGTAGGAVVEGPLLFRAVFFVLFNVAFVVAAWVFGDVVAERRTGQTWPTLVRELGRLHAVTLTGPTGTVTQTTELSTAQQGILRACGLIPPPRITALHPA